MRRSSQLVHAMHRFAAPVVLHVTGNMDRYNGAGQQALTLASHLDFCESRFCYFADVVTMTDHRLGAFSAIKLPGSGVFSRYMAAFRVLLRVRPSVVHIHGFHIGAEFVPLARLLGMRVVVKSTLNGVDDLLSVVNANRFNRLYVRMIQVSNALSSPIEVANRSVIAQEKVVRIPNIVDIPAVGVPISEKDRHVLVVGVICQRKRTHVAITFFVENFGLDETAKLFVIGPRSDRKDELAYFERCKSCIPESVSHRVIFTGQVAHKVVLEHMRKARILLQFSEAEGLPNAVIEAMASNCVPVVSDMGGVAADVIEHALDGYIVEEGDSGPSWKDVDRLIQSNACYRKAVTGFGPASIVSRYRGVYAIT